MNHAQTKLEMPASDQNTLTCKVVRRICFKPENGFCVLACTYLDPATNTMAEVKATGNLSTVRVGDEYTFTGSWGDHPRFGKQFKFTNAEVVLPSGTKGVAKYLATIISGIGPIKAQKIVDELGDDCLTLIRNEPSILEKLDFLTLDQRREIAEDLTKNAVLAELAGMVCHDGVGMGTVMRIYHRFGAESVQTVKEDPYILTRDVWGIGFKTADDIAQKVGIDPKSPGRIQAAILYCLTEESKKGHTFLKPNDIVKKLIHSKGILENSGVEVNDIAREVQTLIDDKFLVREVHAIYHMGLYMAECCVAQAVSSLMMRRVGKDIDFGSVIDEIENRDSVQYASEQRQAIETALQNPVSVITGGPGTGKTTVIKAIIEIFKRYNPMDKLYLAAPTGRASKRMSEATNNNASTIHRLLCYSPQYGGFEFNDENPLPGPGLLIIDEFSMLDIRLAADLLSAVTNLQVVCVGDVDQLPSVGPGAVLRDLILSKQIPTVRLRFNYRQAGGSTIALNAHQICKGEVPALISTGDFEYIEVPDGDSAAEVIQAIVQTFANEKRPPMSYQILCPQRRLTSGVENLNNVIRDIVNPLKDNDRTLGGFRVNDKVLVTENNYRLGVFNGDLGIVLEIKKNALVIDFGGDLICEVTIEQLDILSLAYAMTIHKSQGSEFPIVIMPITTQHYIMLLRNLLYTGFTRAKQRLILISNEKSFNRAVNNNIIEDRYSLLAPRIEKLIKERMTNMYDLPNKIESGGEVNPEVVTNQTDQVVPAQTTQEEIPVTDATSKLGEENPPATPAQEEIPVTDATGTQGEENPPVAASQEAQEAKEEIPVTDAIDTQGEENPPAAAAQEAQEAQEAKEETPVTDAIDTQGEENPPAAAAQEAQEAKEETPVTDAIDTQGEENPPAAAAQGNPVPAEGKKGKK